MTRSDPWPCAAISGIGQIAFVTEMMRAGRATNSNSEETATPLKGGLETVEERVVGPAQGHLDLLRGHRGHVARLLSIQELGRGFPLADRDIAQDGDDGGRGDDRQQCQRREPRGRRQHAGGYSRSASKRWIIASV